MNNNAKAWVAALRSGEFTQGRGSLKSPEGYCCLGVACELFRRAHPEEAGWVHYIRYDQFLLNESGNTHALPLRVMHWLGLRDNYGVFQSDIGEPSLAAMNDTNHTFEEIANMIEMKPDNLFVKEESNAS